MPETLPRIRLDLDFMPSPLQDRPGLLIRDPYQYTDVTLIIPPPLVECLRLFDGKSTDSDLKAALHKVTGEIDNADLEQHLSTALREAGFLDDDHFAEIKRRRHQEFADAPTRLPTHAGGAYPAEPDPLRDVLIKNLGSEGPKTSDGLIGIAAPHVSPDGGWPTYKAAYRALGVDLADKVFVILGTSHYGAPNRFGLTRKNFVTPLGEAQTDTALVDRLARQAPNSVAMEDYCHSAEHSIEFQVLFLQHLYGPGVRILPILCGSYAKSIYEGGLPDDDENVRRFLGELGELAVADERLKWVLGIDMAHMGRRYGDPFTAQADTGEMVRVTARDMARCDRITEGDTEGFWELVQHNHDDLKWCGSSPLYTFLKVNPQARAEVLDYRQWNIDEQSVVSFAAMAFRNHSE